MAGTVEPTLPQKPGPAENDWDFRGDFCGNLKIVPQSHASRTCPRWEASATLTAMQLSEFQQLIRRRYFATDSARGPAGTFLWFSEEVGELAHAIGKHQRGDRSPDDRANLHEEFADVLAWLATLANILEVDLTHAVINKYVTDGGPEGTK
jgi:NTP pyrophosphatase (non-canonical NTP hydrolase)